MKHAYLIIAHNEFAILQALISSLDDERNSLFVHIDRKSGKLPQLTVTRASLLYTPKRYDVRWGNVSQIETELSLMEYAVAQGAFDYYHIISGVTLPLQNLDTIDAYFKGAKGRSVFCPFEVERFKETENYKVRYYNFFTRWVANKAVKTYAQFLWTAANYIQKRAGVFRHENKTYYSAANWCSLNEKHIRYLVAHKSEILRGYKYTYCADEVFAPTELLKEYGEDEFLLDKHYLYVEWVGNAPRVLSMTEMSMLAGQHFIFARKFSNSRI